MDKVHEGGKRGKGGGNAPPMPFPPRVCGTDWGVKGSGGGDNGCLHGWGKGRRRRDTLYQRGRRD